METGLLEPEDVTDATNQLLDLLGMSFYEEPAKEYHAVELEPVLAAILDYAWQQGLLEENTTVYRDLFDTALMGRLMPRPSTVIANFRKFYRENPEKATDYFYKLSQDSDYIRRYRIKKTRSGTHRRNMGLWRSLLIWRSRKRIRRPLRRREKPGQRDTPNACCAGKTKAMPGGWTIRRGRITG